MIKERTGFIYSVLICFLVSLYGGNALSQPYEPVSEISGESGQQVDPEKLKRLNEAREKFRQAWGSKLPDAAKGVITTRCRDNWDTYITGSTSIEQMINRYKDCHAQMGKKGNTLINLHTRLSNELSSVPYSNLFREHDITSLSNQLNEVRNTNLSYQSTSIYGSSCDQNSFCPVFLTANIIALLEQEDFQAFLKDREELMKMFRCDHNNDSMANCLTHIGNTAKHAKECLIDKGFKICRPFLPCERDGKVKEIIALFPELTQEEKNGMKYICWKAVTQGSQCCMNPQQCPTNGAFSGIASALKKAAPGLVQQYAQMKAMTGDYEAACRARLMANAAGPLSQLQSDTCQKSLRKCEETCDEAVQKFKTSLKQAVAGEKAGEFTLDQIMEAAGVIHDKGDLPDEPTESEKEYATETETTNIKTCSLAVYKINKDFKHIKEGSKRMIGLKESTNHASVVDCSGELNKYSLYNQGGAGAGRMGGNPMAAHMCRQGAPGGVIPPPRPRVGPTRNPNMGSGHLFGGKTHPGFKGSPPFPGPGAPVDDEFISPEKGPAGMGQLSGGWTGASGDGSSGGSGGASGGGSPGSPSRGEEEGSEEGRDNLPINYPEAFDIGGGSGRDGGSLSSADLARMKMAQYMKKKDKKEALEKEKKRKEEIDAQGSIFFRISQTIRAYCKQVGCEEEPSDPNAKPVRLAKPDAKPVRLTKPDAKNTP